MWMHVYTYVSLMLVCNSMYALINILSAGNVPRALGLESGTKWKGKSLLRPWHSDCTQYLESDGFSPCRAVRVCLSLYVSLNDNTGRGVHQDSTPYCRLIRSIKTAYEPNITTSQTIYEIVIAKENGYGCYRSSLPYSGSFSHRIRYGQTSYTSMRCQSGWRH